MTGLDTYIAVLHELKHEHTTSMTPEEFNFHIWRSEIEYVATRYWAQDQHQKSIDDLAFVTVETNGIAGAPVAILNAGANTAGVEYFPMPQDLFILLNVAVQVRIYGDPCIADGTLSAFTAAHYLAADREKVVSESYYSKPSHEYPTLYYKIRKRNILPKAGQSIAQSCVITYLQYPTRISVDPITGANVTDSPFGDSQTLEIVRHCVLSYLETIESGRLATMANVEQLKFSQSPLPNQII